MTIKESGGLVGEMPHIEGHRIGVHHIVRAWVDRDLRIEEIADREYPQLSEIQVRDALTYALSNEDEFKELSEKREELKEELKEQAICGPEELEEAINES